jgi:hypothetical protein
MSQSKSWTKSWSGRGTAILNMLERLNVSEEQARHNLSVLEKLEFLTKKFPKDNFFKSLQQQSINKPLSERQVQCISNQYRDVFQRKGRYA